MLIRMDKQYIAVCVFTVLLLSVPVLGDSENNEKSDSYFSSWTMDDVWCVTKTYGGTFAVGVGAVAAAPVVLGTAGFTAGGIAAGSLAAKAMAISATANGGGIVAGGVIASLQSVGVTGLGLMGKTVVATTAGAAYRYLVGDCSDENV